MPEPIDEAAWLREEIAKRRYLAQHICHVEWINFRFGEFITLDRVEPKEFKSIIRDFPRISGYPVYCCIVGSWDNPRIFIYPCPPEKYLRRLRVRYADGTIKDVDALDYEKDWTDPA